jgi:uncharacterized protein YfaS (alpha-2-macroglobulin family)
VIVGAILMDPGRLAPPPPAAVPFQSYNPGPENNLDVPAPRVSSSTTSAPKELSAAETPLWRPLMVCGADGRAEVDFPMPETESALVLTIRAHAEGREGEYRAEIRVAQPSQ